MKQIIFSARNDKGEPLIEVAARHGERQDPAEMLELFQRDRNQHVDQVIRPALEAGKIVICDRYFYSTIAYQGAYWNEKDPRGIPASLNPIRILEASQEHYPVPDLVIILNCPVRVALARIQLERAKNKMFECDEAYLELVRYRFSQILLPETVHIDSVDSIDKVFERVWAAVEPILKLWQKQMKGG